MIQLRVLVVGGAGYVGSHVVRALLESGHEPIVYDNLSTGNVGSVTDAELVVGDIGDKERLGTTLRRLPFDGVVHLAAVSLVGESVRNPARYFHNNVANSLVLFDSLITADVPWVVLSSTAAVYGDPSEIPIPEDHRKQPTNPYGDSKFMLEQILGWYERAYGFRSVSLRYFNAAGAHPSGRIGEDHVPETHLIPLTLQVALGQREALEIFGCDYPTPDGTAIRDFVHVCDLADAHLAALNHLQTNAISTAYNLGSEQGFSVHEILAEARKVTGRPIPVRLGARRAGDPPILVASAAKARAELGWRPRFHLNEILTTAWDWLQSHPLGYRS